MIVAVPSFRSDGPETDDGEAGGAQDPLGTEEDDRGGDRGQQQHHQLQGLRQDDAGQTLGGAQTVSAPVRGMERGLCV